MDDYSPLKEILKPKAHGKKRGFRVNEAHTFMLLIAVFILGVALTNLENISISGKLIYEENSEILNISSVYNSSGNISLSLKGNITSLRLTGAFIGDGTAKIYLGNSIVIDSQDIKSKNGNLITGMQIFVEEEDLVGDEINSNGSQPEIEVIETADLSNETTNKTETILETEIDDVSNETSNETEISFETEMNNVSNETTNETETSLEIEMDDIFNETIDETETKFENYCLETCSINSIENITLIIELDNLLLNLTTIEYTYLFGIEEENISLANETEGTISNETNSSLNSTLDFSNITEEPIENTTLNETIDEILNVTFNETEIAINDTIINETINETINESIDEPLGNITLNETEVYENISENITEANITETPIILSELETFNLTLTENGMRILHYADDIKEYKVGKDENNFVIFTNENLTGIDIDIKNSEDERLSTSIVVLDNLKEPAFVNLESKDADTILRCTQFTNDTCKRWEKTGIRPDMNDGQISFSTESSGVYAAAAILAEKKEYVLTNSVYYNSDCEYCERPYVCDAERFCPMQNAIYKKVTFTTQLDFDILNLDSSWETAEVCAYSYYNSGVSVLNYLKDGPESFCSDLRNGNSSSDIISFKLIPNVDGWTCIDATLLIRNAESNYYSNVFINWLGEDLQETNSPYNCYYGMASLDKCDSNPSGANDCRPYLKLTYK